MPSVSYGNTLTDLGRNIAEQKASEQALAGILAQVGAQKLAALNALAANRGRTQADRDVGMDRNATTRQVAVMESMLRAQELGDRDRQSREGLAAAAEIARLQGANQLEVGRLPYSPEALKQLEALARLNAQTLNPRMQETIFAEDAERERQNLRAQSLSMDANRKASLLYQDWITKKASRRWWKPDDSDEELNAAYQTGINGILSGYGERDAGLVQSMTRPDGRVIFQPMQLPMIRPQVPQQVPTETGTTNAVPTVPAAVPVPQARAVPNMAVPNVGGASGSWQPNFAVPDATTRERALRMARELKELGLPDEEIRNRIYAAHPQLGWSALERSKF